MAAVASSPQTDMALPEARTRSTSTFSRVARYTGFRIVSLLLTVIAGVYLTILIANMGGYVDEIRRGTIAEQVSFAASLNPQYRLMDQAQRERWVNDQIVIQEKRYGLDQPFILRSFRYLWGAMILDFGFSENMASDSGSRLVRLIILERLPSTLVLFATSQIIIFFISIFFALSLSRRYGSFFDKLIVALTPSSAAPGWFYGIFLIMIFAGVLHVLPFGGMVDAPPPRNPIAYGLSLAEHMILPVLALLISALALNVYSWRTFFLIYSSEDYVELAKAKGLSDRVIENRYILRPTLPTIITTFALVLIRLWEGAIILETVFNWPGLGRLIYQAIGLYDTPVIVATTVIYAYLLAITVFLLDLIYALVDPRVKVGDEGRKAA